MTNSDFWIENFEAFKAHVVQTAIFPNKYNSLNSRCCYFRKRIKAGSMPETQKALFEALAASSPREYIGGRKKKI